MKLLDQCCGSINNGENVIEPHDLCLTIITRTPERLLLIQKYKINKHWQGCIMAPDNMTNPGSLPSLTDKVAELS